MKRFSQQLTVCCHLNFRPAVFQLSGVRICLHTNGEGRRKRKNSKNKPWNGTVQLKHKDTKSPQAEKQDLVTKYLHLQFWVLATSHTPAAPLAQKDIYSPLFVGRHRKRSTLGSSIKNPTLIKHQGTAPIPRCLLFSDTDSSSCRPRCGFTQASNWLLSYSSDKVKRCFINPSKGCSWCAWLFYSLL